MSTEYNRNIRDAQFVTSKAFPAANASVATASFDLGQKTAGEIEQIEAEVVIPALANNTDAGKTSTIVLQDSADDSSFAATDPLVQTSIPGVVSTGSAAKTVRFRFPPGTRRYVRLLASVPTGGGDHTAASLEFNLRF